MNNPYIPSNYWEKRFSNDGLSLCSVGYSELGLIYNNWLYRARFLALDRALHKVGINISKSNLLDVGVGSGAYIDFWRKKGISDLLGLDITEISVNTLKEKYPTYSFAKCDITHVEIENICGLFDVATAFDVLFHVVDDIDFHKALANIAKLIKNGGWLIISDGFCNLPWGPKFHEYHRTFQDYQNTLKENNIVIKHLEPIFFIMTTPLCGSKYMNYLSILLNRSISILKRRPYTRWIIELLGATLFTIDALLGHFLTSGPSLKFMLAQKIVPTNNGNKSSI